MTSNDLGLYLLAAIISMAISMVITPLMIRWAPTFGMMDQPDQRKVHESPIPRVGGIGIVIGLLSPLFIWLDFTPFISSFIFGCLVLLIFGTWDDAKDLGPYVKFMGQLVAVIAIVYYGDLYISHFPFLRVGVIPEYIAKPITIVALVGMINALNLSDGLDGLAGGEALLSLIAIAYLSYSNDSALAVLMSISAIGGIFGFLRFNSHPARVFMGDGGSQTLGFILGVLVIYLSQVANSLMTPVIPMLILGLPVIDALVVFLIRARRKVSLFVATKDHLHHRLLARGFYHYESVVIIYSIQVVFAFCSVFLIYESDLLAFIIYVLLALVVFLTLILLEKNNFLVHACENVNERVFLDHVFINYSFLKVFPSWILEGGLSLFLIFAAFSSNLIPVDFGLFSLGLLGLLLLTLVAGSFSIPLLRLVLFVSIGFSIYLLSSYPPNWFLKWTAITYLFYALMAISAFISARMIIAEKFRITPLDYLLIMMALVMGFVSASGLDSLGITLIVVQIIILFYACEIFIQSRKSGSKILSISVCASLSVMAIRGITI
ncbi:MAG: undecaprenyl/decaprenyl-phosphate alpha-N-acetylglucosaminyl 1-phosphate transferase [Gammaproteobacteria bacterium]|nr:undecaprenyl/decaprenyl-phosphate alpha-N-acetylglucosaminyl 1-phosphate transferase [Gammaproteobacteria bacterium]